MEELDSLLPAPDYPSLTVIPKPGLCVKTKNDKGLKFFVNICKLSEVRLGLIRDLANISEIYSRFQLHHAWRKGSLRG